MDIIALRPKLAVQLGVHIFGKWPTPITEKDL